MLIRINRDPLEPNAEHVFGEMSIDGKPFCVTMEPPLREDRVFLPCESALPPNHYNLSLTYCRRFRKEVPLLVAISGEYPERRASHYLLGMRIHPGIRVHDSCAEIVVGRRRVGRTIVETVEAFEALVFRIKAVMKHESLDDKPEAVEVQIT